MSKFSAPLSYKRPMIWVNPMKFYPRYPGILDMFEEINARITQEEINVQLLGLALDDLIGLQMQVETAQVIVPGSS